MTIKRTIVYIFESLVCIVGIVCALMHRYGLSKRLLLHDIKYPASSLSSPVLVVIIAAGIMLFCVFPVLLMVSSDRIRVDFIIKVAGQSTEIRVSKIIGLLIRIVMGAMTLACGIFAVYYLITAKGVNTNSDWNEDAYVAHAGGAVDGIPYSNCLEAIEQNYAKGFRTFEIDLLRSTDGYVLCKHDWDYCMQDDLEPGVAVDRDTFLGAPIKGVYTPICLQDIFDIMRQYPDIYIVTDTKNSDTESVIKDFESIVAEAHKYEAEDLLNRFIIQIYNEEMYFTVKNVYPFENWIYTLYQFWGGTDSEFNDFSRFCAKNKIQAIACWNYLANPTIVNIAAEYGVDVYVHTENDAEAAREMFEIGIKGIYTDSVVPDSLKED